MGQNRVSVPGSYYSFNPHLTDNKGVESPLRRIMIGWVTGSKSPTTSVPFWQGAHSLPRLLTVKGSYIVQKPVPELRALRILQSHFHVGFVNIPQGHNQRLYLPKQVKGDAFEIIACFSYQFSSQHASEQSSKTAIYDFSAGSAIKKGAHVNHIGKSKTLLNNATRFGVKVRVEIDEKTGEVTEAESIFFEPSSITIGSSGYKDIASRGNTTTVTAFAGIAPPTSPQCHIAHNGTGMVEMHIYMDRSILEVYSGGAVITRRLFPKNPTGAINVELFSEPGEDSLSKVDLIGLDFWKMSSMSV